MILQVFNTFLKATFIENQQILLRESEEINLPANPAEKQMSLSLENISGKLKTSDSLSTTAKFTKKALKL